MNEKKFPLTKEETLRLIERYPTPFHLYDEAKIRANFRRLRETFAWAPSFREHFAVKALPNPRIVQILHEDGASGRHRTRVGDAVPIKRRCTAHKIQHRICLIEAAVKIEAHLVEVLDITRRCICIDVECVARHNITGGAARSTAIECNIRERGRVKRTVTLAEVDGIPRRLARAVRIAAIDFITAAEYSAFDVDDVACGIARRNVVRRYECRVRRNVSTVELAARIQRTAVNVDGVVLRVGIL